MTSATTLQNPREIAEFAMLLMDEGIRSYLEIGSKYGGSLRRVAELMPPGSRVVAVDMPHGTGSWEQSNISLRKCIAELNGRGLDARVIWGDSTDPAVVEKVRARGPFDCVLIDANHTLPYVSKDFMNYGPMARIIAFHDISFHRDIPPVTPIDVPEFWKELKSRYQDKYRFKELKYEPDNNGLGILWRS